MFLHTPGVFGVFAGVFFPGVFARGVLHVFTSNLENISSMELDDGCTIDLYGVVVMGGVL